MIVVHHLANSRSQRVLWLLEELGVPYDLVRYERDPATNLAPPELVAVHPLGKSPVVDVDGATVIESGAIVEFLCERFGADSGLVPARGTDAHLRHLQLMHFAEGSAMTPILLDIYAARLGAAGEPLRPRIDQQLATHFDFLEDELNDSGHFIGADLSAADIMLSFPAEVAVMKGAGGARPKLDCFVKAIHARPAWQRARERGGPYFGT